MMLDKRIAALSLEERLILAAASTRPDAAALARVRQLAGGALDWDRLVALARRHNVTPLLLRTLTTAGVCLPAHVAAALHGEARLMTMTNMVLLGELQRVLAVLRDADVPAAPYKGPVLALQAYGDLGLRSCGDLDVLIHPGDLARARAALEGAGYARLPEWEGYCFDGHTERYHEYAMVTAGGQIRCDLQWGVMSEPFTFPRNMESCWSQFEPLVVGGQPIPNLPLNLLLMVLSVHGAKHLWERLFWLVDIAELLQRSTPDWHALLAEARAQGVERLLLLGLLLAHRLLEAPVPGWLVQRMQRDHTLLDLAARACGYLFSPQLLTKEELNKRNLFLLQGQERLRDRVAICARYADRLLNPVRTYQRYGLQPLKRLLGLH